MTVRLSTNAAAAIRVGVGFAAVKLLLHLSMLTRYGQHRDEYYFQDCARFLDFGYVDHAPLTPWLVWLTQTVLGDSLFALRLPAALAGALTVYLGAHLVARLGGGAFAAALCCAAILCSLRAQCRSQPTGPCLRAARWRHCWSSPAPAWR